MLQIYKPNSNLLDFSVFFFNIRFLTKFTTLSAKRLTNNPHESPTAVHKITWLAIALEEEKKKMSEQSDGFWLQKLSECEERVSNTQQVRKVHNQEAGLHRMCF